MTLLCVFCGDIIYEQSLFINFSLVSVGDDVESHAGDLSDVVISLCWGQPRHDHVTVVDAVHLVHLVLAHAVVKHLVVGVQHHHHLPR